MGRNRNVLLGTFVVFFAILFLIYPSSANSLGNFTVSPGSVYVNWTSGVINITSLNANNISFYYIQNTTEAITSQYFTSSAYQSGDYPNYGDQNSSKCFTIGSSGMKFIVQNASSGTYTNATDPMNQTNTTLYNIIAYQFCPPGYYNGTFNVTRNDTSEYANITAIINIPINPSNTFYEPDSTAFVKGTLAANSSLIHKYYFNTSIAQNLTGITINISGWSQYIDLYLFNSSGSLLTKSVGSVTAGYYMYQNLPTTSDIWQIWVWGNVTSPQDYWASMYFTTLNVTNTSNTNQKITSINFGDLSPMGNQSSQVNITLTNVDTKEWSGVKEKSEIYRTDAWTNRSAASDYYFLVPHFATKVKVKIEWTGGTRWFISLNDSNRNFLGNSSIKFQSGNLTNTVEEENVLYAGTINTDNDGLWKITVGNTTAAANNYNVTAQVWYNSAAWLSSNYPTDGFNFKASNETENVSKNVSLGIALPLPNITNGNYSGFIDYYRPNEWVTRIPISFTVRAGTLLVNNTLGSASETKNENTGFNRVGDNIAITLPINNTGGYDIYFVNTTSNGTLWKDSNYMNFTVEWPSNPIQASSSANLKINITINTSKTGNSEGIYIGLIRLSTTNSTNSSSVSYPFDVFDVNLSVNLSSLLVVNITAVTPTFIAAPTNNTNNMTFNVTVQLANGTIISKDLMPINENDFVNMQIVDQNYSSNTPEFDANVKTLTGYTNSSIIAPWTSVCPTAGGYSYCRINGTLAAGAPGATYYTRITVSVNTSKLGGTGDLNLTGTGTGAALVTVNDTGLRIHPNMFNDDDDFYEGKDTYYKVNITNYGPVAVSNAILMLNKGTSDDCAAIQTVVTYASSSCSVGTVAQNVTNSKVWIVSLPAYMTGAVNCTVTWRIVAATVNVNTDCQMNLGFVSNHTNYGNYTKLIITVLNNATTAADEDSGQQGQQTTCTSNTTCTSTQYCKNSACTTLTCQSGWTAVNHKCTPKAGSLNITDYTAKVYVLQGSSNTTKVTVKNTGGYTYTTKLSATPPVDGITAVVTPASYNLGSGNSGIFTITFNVSDSVEVGYHTVALKAYANENSSVYLTKDIIVAVQPKESTKADINNTRDDLKGLFASVTSLFNSMPPGQDANYTLANRTYTRILNMFQDIENNINAGNYLEANSLLKELNSSITEFKQQVDQLGGGGIGSLLGAGMGGTLTLVAILVVIIVIGAFLAYLLMPSKKGYHPVLGYVSKEKVSITHRITHVFSKLKLGGRQKSLGDFGRTAAPSVQPVPSVATARPESNQPEKRTYMDGYHKLDQFPLAYDKNKFKEKK